MRKYLLLTLALLVMPAAARACTLGGADQAAQERDLGARLAKSEYVVEKGELRRRPEAAQGAATTPLGRDEELEVMRKGLAAARAKLSIADGSGVVIEDGKEHYEVVIGSPTPAGSLGPDYTAKVLFDKKTLAVAKLVTKDMKHDEEVARKVAQYRDLRERLANSEYVVVGGELARRPEAAQGAATTPLGRDEELEVMRKGLAAARAKLSIADGSGVVIEDGKEHYEVVIGSPTPAGSLGPDYTAKVLFDKKTLAVAQILAGG